MAEKKPKKTVPKVKNPPQGSNPWDVAPILDGGDPDPVALYTAVGMALSTWERLDQILSHIFGVLVGSRLGAASAAYGVVVASSGRMEMVTTAGDLILKEDPTLLAKLTTYVNTAGKLIARRTEIAHGVVSNFQEGRDGYVFERGHYLIPASYATRKRSKKERGWAEPMVLKGTYAYTADQVQAYAANFHAHYLEGARLMFEIKDYCDKKWPPPKPRLPKSKP